MRSNSSIKLKNKSKNKRSQRRNRSWRAYRRPSRSW